MQETLQDVANGPPGGGGAGSTIEPIPGYPLIPITHKNPPKEPIN